ncbi:nucleoside-diphosphate sugar epimerase [Asanoa ishikariensis]|uniref:SDR family oxidoreductase n=1 Tax=Asanoa ishikariensis TaxID=137265 RepID=UPI000B84BBAF|nr:NAD(P)H-binding protein [Asanoa ishikariensis]GIF68949.1 nucleoside-diphosphate sugar epimerase [Asanoa ishikariensis]
MRVLVIGGSGVVGRPTASTLFQRGHQVAVLSRGGTAGPAGTEAFQGDLTTGAGLDQALAGVDCVVDCANVATMSRAAAVRYFTDTTTLLGRRAEAAGVKHHVVLSIVGIDKVPQGYFSGKLAQEEAVLGGPVPATVLRATQFHEFAGQVMGQLAVGRFALVPQMVTQPIAAAEVGAALAEVVEDGPRGRVPDIGGPRVERLPDLARQLVRHRGLGRTVVPLWLPGKAGRAMRGSGQLPGPGAVLRGPTFAEWLRDQ